jgi:hypothetical protein
MIGTLAWQKRHYKKRIKERMEELKVKDYPRYMELVEEVPHDDADDPTKLRDLLLRFFPYHVSWKTAILGLAFNLYLFLTIILVFVTAIRLNAMTTRDWIIAAVVATFVLVSSLLGKSVFHVIRHRMMSGLSDRLYFTFVAFILIVLTAEFFAGSLGKRDAREFMVGHGAGSYLTIFDVRGDRPHLEEETFRVVIQRDGNYYVVPSDQDDIENATLVVIPQAEIISQTTEAVRPDE